MTAGVLCGGPLELGKDAGGNRHYLADVPVPLGAMLELQEVEVVAIDADGDEVLGTVNRWVPVRYEASLAAEEPVVWLFASLGGHRVRLRAQEGMRFRWPGGGR